MVLGKEYTIACTWPYEGPDMSVAMKLMEEANTRYTLNCELLLSFVTLLFCCVCVVGNKKLCLRRLQPFWSTTALTPTIKAMYYWKINHNDYLEIFVFISFYV